MSIQYGWTAIMKRPQTPPALIRQEPDPLAILVV